MGTFKKAMEINIWRIFTDESKYILEKCEELWTKLNDLIRSKTNNLDNYDEKCMKIKFNLEMIYR